MSQKELPPLITKQSYQWAYPTWIKNDLQQINLPEEKKDEILTCALEYTRCVIPSYTNKRRYVAFMQTIIIGTIAEFCGDLVSVSEQENILGYHLETVLSDLFGGTNVHAEMAREYRSFLLITAEKTKSTRDGSLYARYTHALQQSPRQFFRLRDADALARFTIAAALACNDGLEADDSWFSEEQLSVLCETAVVMYDAVAYHKHQAEAEIHSTFRYVSCKKQRVSMYESCRGLLWALDTAWLSCKNPKFRIVIAFLRAFGGPIHMMMRRYRFVEDDLVIGKPADEEVIEQTKQNFKLWHRLELSDGDSSAEDRYQKLLARSDTLMFPGLRQILEQSDTALQENDMKDSFEQMRESQEHSWNEHLKSLVHRMEVAFPEIIDFSRSH